MSFSAESQDYSDLPEKPSRFPALSILRTFWKRRWFVLGLWVIGTIAGFGIVRVIPPVYRAEAVVLVDSQKIPEVFVSPTVNGDVTERLALITQNIMTSTRLLDTIRSFDLYRNERSRLTQEELLRKMRDDISISFEKSWTGGRTQAFRLSYQGPNAKIVTAVTNRLANLYVEENVRSREDQAQGTVAFLRAQLVDAKKSLDEQEAKVARFKEEHNGTLPEQQQSLLGTLSSLSVQVEGVQEAISRAHENKMSLEAALSAARSSEAAVRASMHRQLNASADAGFGAALPLKPKSEVLQNQLRQLLLRYSPEHPSVQVLEQQLAEAKREEAEEANITDDSKNTSTARSRPAITSPELLQLAERITNLRAQIAVADHQIESLDKERQQLAAAIADCQTRIAKLPMVEQEMVALKRNYEESANNYKSLLQKQLAAGMATDMERSQKSERFTISDAARVPEQPIKPKRPVVVSLASVVALVIGLLIAFGLEFRKQMFLGEWELPPGTVVLGRVPVIRMAPTPATKG
ncbi:MAG: GumC family protein [Bryobacteraceae bacterium]